METIEKRAEIFALKDNPTDYGDGKVQEIRAYKYFGYVQGATEQKAIDIKALPQLYVRWLMIDGEKPSWEEYANKAMED